jgi:hypothetical protein
MTKVLLTIVLIFNLIYAESLDNISKFANQICDEIETSGSISRSDIKIKLFGKISPLSKILGVKLNANGSYRINDIKFEGLPYQFIPKQMKDSRECKKEIVFILLEERTLINKTKRTKKGYYLEDNQYGSVHLFEKPGITSIPKEVCEVEAKTSVEKIREKKTTLGTFVYVRILNGDNKGKLGWTGKSHLHRQ